MEFVGIFLLFLMLGSSAAVTQDLSGKMFTFPEETNTAHVRLTPTRTNLGALTVCLRAFTDLSRAHSLFSLATPSHDNDFLIWSDPPHNEKSVYVRDKSAKFKTNDQTINTWQSVCSTWDAATGVAQLWIDGKPLTRKFVSSSSISGSMIITLGQEQDSHGGSFVISESFVGMLSDLHMWDHVLTPEQILSYSPFLNFPEGNVLNWKALEFQITGRVLVEEKQ